MNNKYTELAQSYRKSAFLTASILFIYSISGGSIKGNLSLFGATIIFSSPEVIEYLGVVLVIFFSWSHWQVSEETRKQLQLLLVISKKGNEIKPYYLLWRLVSNRVVKILTKEHIITIYPWGRIKLEIQNKDTGQVIEQEKEHNSLIIAFILSFFIFVKVAILKPEFRNAILPEIIAFISLSTYCYLSISAHM